MDGFVFKCFHTEEVLGVLDNNYLTATGRLCFSENVISDFECIFNNRVDFETALTLFSVASANITVSCSVSLGSW